MKKNLIYIIIFLFIWISTTAFSYLFFTHQKIHTPKKIISPTLAPNQPSPTPTPLPYWHNSTRILLLGYGGHGHDGGNLTDTIIVTYIDHEFKKNYIISIPRDLFIALPLEKNKYESWKINTAYAFGLDDRRFSNKPNQFTGESGGGELAKYATEQVLGFEIDNYISLNFAGFIKSIDEIGGIDIKVQQTFDDFFYPIEEKKDDPCGHSEEEITSTSTMSAKQKQEYFPCRYEHLHFDPGNVHMDGETALKYARSRYSQTQGNDFNRSNRQKQVLIAVKEKIFQLNFIPKIIPFINTLSNDLRTDLSVSEIKQLIDQMRNYSEYEVINITLNTQNTLRLGLSEDRQSILLPKNATSSCLATQDDYFKDIHEFIKQTIVSSSDSASINEK